MIDKNETQKYLMNQSGLPVVGGIYRHYKGGLYVVLAVGIDEPTGTPMVAYRSNARNTTWFRTLENFEEDVLVDQSAVPRFRREGS